VGGGDGGGVGGGRAHLQDGEFSARRWGRRPGSPRRKGRDEDGKRTVRSREKAAKRRRIPRRSGTSHTDAPISAVRDINAIERFRARVNIVVFQCILRVLDGCERFSP